MYRSLIRNIMPWFVICLCLMASSCGENAFTGGGGNPPGTKTAISGMSVTGNYTDGTDGIEVINGTSDFLLSWDVGSSSTYTFEVALSANTELSPTDLVFFSGTCGIGKTCNASGDFQCTFDPADKTIACGGSGAVDASTILTGSSPQLVYVFFSATNEMQDSTDTKYQPVKFEFQVP